MTENKYRVSFILTSEVYCDNIEEAIRATADEWGVDENCLHVITEIIAKKI